MRVKFSDIAYFTAGQSPKSTFYSNEKGTPFLQGNRTFGMFYPNIDTYTSKITKIAHKDDILMSVRAPVGDLNFAPEDLCIGRGLAAISAKNGDNKFLYYALKHNISTLLKQSTGTTYGAVSGDIVKNMILVIPDDEDTRKKISGLLYDIDLKIYVNNKISNELESMSKTIYDYWFLQFDFPNENGEPYKSSGGKMVWNEELKKDIPEKWTVNILSSVVSKEKNAIVDGPFGTQMKIDEYVDEGIPIFEMKQLEGNFIVKKNSHYISEAKYNDVKRSTVKNGDIIMSKTGTLGKLGIVRFDKGKGVIVSRLMKITPDEKVIGKYALLMVLQKLTDSDYWIKVSNGSTMPILNNKLVSDIKVIVPNNNLYLTYESIVASFYEKIFNVQKENEELILLRDFLFPMLMNGQVSFNS